MLLQWKASPSGVAVLCFWRFFNYSFICWNTTTILCTSREFQWCEQFCKRSCRSWNDDRTSSLELCFWFVKSLGCEVTVGVKLVQQNDSECVMMKVLANKADKFRQIWIVEVAIAESVRIVSIQTLTSTVITCTYVTDILIARERRA